MATAKKTTKKSTPAKKASTKPKAKSKASSTKTVKAQDHTWAWLAHLTHTVEGVILLSAVGVLFTISLVLTANSARPGDLLYSLDRSFEEINMVGKFSAIDKIDGRISNANERVEEMLDLTPGTSNYTNAIAEADEAFSNVQSDINEQLQDNIGEISVELQNLMTRYTVGEAYFELAVQAGQNDTFTDYSN